MLKTFRQPYFDNGLAGYAYSARFSIKGFDHPLSRYQLGRLIPVIAADQLGFYLQPEVSSWANQGAQIGSGRPLDAWIDAETERMLTQR